MATSVSSVRRWALEYISESKAMVDLLRSTHPFDNLLGAWRDGKISRTGDLPGNVHYEFHGAGCRFWSPQRIVDLDFGPRGRSDGFDAWRLFRYAETNYQENVVPSLDDFSQGIAEMEKSGEVMKLDSNSQLVYFTQGHN